MDDNEEKSLIKEDSADKEKFFSENPEEGYEYDIDYEETYKRIGQGFHYIDFLDTPLALRKQVYWRKMPRCHVVLNLLRLSFYQYFITSCQYSSGLLISVLLIAELTKLVYTVGCYIKFRHLNTLGAFVAESA